MLTVGIIIQLLVDHLNFLKIFEHTNFVDAGLGANIRLHGG
jgi:hypothetical protein